MLQVGACGSLSVSLDATVTAKFQDMTITEYPTLDGYEGSWQVEDLNGNIVTTGYSFENQDSESSLDPIERSYMQFLLPKIWVITILNGFLLQQN